MQREQPLQRRKEVREKASARHRAGYLGGARDTGCAQGAAKARKGRGGLNTRPSPKEAGLRRVQRRVPYSDLPVTVIPPTPSRRLRVGGVILA